MGHWGRLRVVLCAYRVSLQTKYTVKERGSRHWNNRNWRHTQSKNRHHGLWNNRKWRYTQSQNRDHGTETTVCDVIHSQRTGTAALKQQEVTSYTVKEAGSAEQSLASACQKLCYKGVINITVAHKRSPKFPIYATFLRTLKSTCSAEHASGKGISGEISRHYYSRNWRHFLVIVIWDF